MRFELSTLSEHVNTRTVVARVLDVIDGPQLVWSKAGPAREFIPPAVPDLPDTSSKAVGVWSRPFPSPIEDRGWMQFDILHLPRTTSAQHAQSGDDLDATERIEGQIDPESKRGIPGRPKDMRKYVLTPVPKPGALLPQPQWPSKVYAVNVDEDTPASRALRPLVNLWMKERS